MIPQVAASERGRAQTMVRAPWGLGPHLVLPILAERYWKDRPKRVKAPYVKDESTEQNPEYHETRETLWE